MYNFYVKFRFFLAIVCPNRRRLEGLSISGKGERRGTVASVEFFIDLTARCPPSTLCFPALNYDSRPLVPLEAAW